MNPFQCADSVGRFLRRRIQYGYMATAATTMHIDVDHLVVSTESDVEQKILMPLLNGEAYLSIPQIQVRTKEYLAPAKLDKEAGKTSGYFPDYSIWSCGFLIMVVEAKAPRVPVEEGYREASLYARHINQNYPTDDVLQPDEAAKHTR